MSKTEREIYLEFIINEIDGALCNYCNTVRDSDHPFHPLDESAQKRTFQDLCDAYNLWHERNPEIGDISMEFFRKHEQYEMILRELLHDKYGPRTVEFVRKHAEEALKGNE